MAGPRLRRRTATRARSAARNRLASRNVVQQFTQFGIGPGGVVLPNRLEQGRVRVALVGDHVPQQSKHRQIPLEQFSYSPYKTISWPWPRRLEITKEVPTAVLRVFRVFRGQASRLPSLPRRSSSYGDRTNALGRFHSDVGGSQPRVPFWRPRRRLGGRTDGASRRARPAQHAERPQGVSSGSARRRPPSISKWTWPGCGFSSGQRP